jgi:hypothetical protein
MQLSKFVPRDLQKLIICEYHPEGRRHSQSTLTTTEKPESRLRHTYKVCKRVRPEKAPFAINVILLSVKLLENEFA